MSPSIIKNNGKSALKHVSNIKIRQRFALSHLQQSTASRTHCQNIDTIINWSSRNISDWKKRQKSDPFIKKRDQLGVRSRAYFKLKEILEKYKIRRMKVVVDLGCSPGSWMECILKEWKENGTKNNICIGIDLLKVQPLNKTRDLGIDVVESWFVERASSKRNDNNTRSKETCPIAIDSKLECDKMDILRSESLIEDFFGPKSKSSINSKISSSNEMKPFEERNTEYHKRPESNADKKFIPRNVTQEEIDSLLQQEEATMNESEEVSEHQIAVHTFKNSKLKHTAHILKGDFTDSDMQNAIKMLLPKRTFIDLVLSDMAPEVSGIRDVDHDDIILLAEQAFEFACQNLEYNGCFICKLFQGGQEVAFRDKVKESFDKVVFFKPDSSRSDSREIFLVALGYRGTSNQSIENRNEMDEATTTFLEDYIH